jgi:hypothetical protein
MTFNELYTILENDFMNGLDDVDKEAFFHKIGVNPNDLEKCGEGWVAKSLKNKPKSLEKDCVLTFDGSKIWYKNGEHHRDNGPAIEWASGSKTWWKNGKRHRDDGPAIENADGTKEWWKDGKWHRDNGPAVERADGSKAWYKNGVLHRDDGPAVEWADGTKVWYKNGVKIK